MTQNPSGVPGDYTRVTRNPGSIDRAPSSMHRYISPNGLHMIEVGERTGTRLGYKRTNTDAPWQYVGMYPWSVTKEQHTIPELIVVRRGVRR